MTNEKDFLPLPSSSHLFLKHDADHVIPDVSLPLKLLLVIRQIRQKRGDVEHDFPSVPQSRVIRLVSGVVRLHVQSAAESFKAFQTHSVGDQVHEAH